MAIKKEMKAWAVKLRGRSFFLRTAGTPWIFGNKKEAYYFAQSYIEHYGVFAKAVRVRVLVEEV